MIEPREWPAHEKRPTEYEIFYHAITTLNIVGLDLGRHESKTGSMVLSRSVGHVMGRTVITRLLRMYASKSYPECGEMIGVGHTTLVENNNSSIGQSDAMTLICNHIVDQILKMRKAEQL